MRISMNEYLDLKKQNDSVRFSSNSKYKNIKVEIDGHVFDSKAEARRYEELKLMKQAGEINGFGLQPSFVLDVGIRYRPDFIVCGKDGLIWVEDIKGVQTKEFKIKKRLWENKYPWLELRLITGL